MRAPVLKRPRRRLFLLTLIVFFACQIGSPAAPTPQPQEFIQPSATKPAGAPFSTPTTAGVSPTVTSTPTDEPTRIQVEVPLADGTVLLADPLPAGDTLELLQSFITDGVWTDAEGTIQLLRLYLGEIGPEGIPGSVDVMTEEGTGLVQHAAEMLEDPALSPEDAAEIRRLLSQLAPTQEVLEMISEPEPETGSRGGFLARRVEQEQESPCLELETLGYYEDDVQPGTVCFYRIRGQAQGVDFQIYYPREWFEDEEQMLPVHLTVDAVLESFDKYVQWGDLRNVHVLFSQRTQVSEEWRTVKGYQVPNFMFDECAIAILGISLNLSDKQFKQAVAHELFHCFQDWNMFTKPTAEHAWWTEGSAQYFSNVVYPNANLELDYTGHFNNHSTFKTLFEMRYENFVFFQHLANHIGDQALVDMLIEMSFFGGRSAHESYLSGIPYMEGLFHDMFVTFFSTGIQDSGREKIKDSPVGVTDLVNIVEEDEFDFETKPFKGTRYGLLYDKEKRFVQSGEPEGEGQYSMVLKRLIDDPTAWSDLPQEIRSACNGRSPYLFLMTSTKDPYEFHLQVGEVEKASCDPCVLGSWNVDRQSYTDYLLMMPELAALGNYQLRIEGNYYLTFSEERELTSLRDDFTTDQTYVDPSTNQTVNVRMVVDAHGAGEYSADGETIEFQNWIQTLDNIFGFVNDMAINIGPETSGVNFLGLQSNGVPFGLGGPDEKSGAGAYTCSNQRLVITNDQGTVAWDRVQEIPPTAVPTPFGEPTESP